MQKEIIKVLGHHILVKIVKDKEKTSSGIIIPSSIVEESKYGSCVAEVVQIGESCYKDRMFYGAEPWVKVGDHVLYPRNSGTRIQIDDEDFIILRDSCPVAVVDSTINVKRT